MAHRAADSAKIDAYILAPPYNRASTPALWACRGKKIEPLAGTTSRG